MSEQQETSQCVPRWCTVPEECRPFGQVCTTAKDCKPTSCCVVLELDNIALSTPGSMLPQARIAPCNSLNGGIGVYCDGVCATSNPSWSAFSDSQVIKVLQAGLNNGSGSGSGSSSSSSTGSSSSSTDTGGNVRLRFNQNKYENMVTARYLALMRRQ